ncbi:unnamed protein product [Parnassius apollo]|uniref:(apollo) hypothetical protein n=1 Tax=Parnassius apollo TaxID=110799 RepID=A0A8S3XEE9_PARAO|nr:unnamed protein product [Parnassius apollo]
MNSRSKRMLALVKNDDKGTDVDQRILFNNNNGIEKSEEQSTHITAEQTCESPLPLEAVEILSIQLMQDVWNDALSENDIQEPPVTYHQDESIAADSVPEQNEDPFMPVGEMTPISAIDFPPSETSQTENPSEELKEQHKRHQSYKTISRKLKNSDKNAAVLSNGPIDITNDKYKDIISLCETGIIPEKYHPYFRSLPHSLTVEASGYADGTDDDDDDC